MERTKEELVNLLHRDRTMNKIENCHPSQPLPPAVSTVIDIVQEGWQAPILVRLEFLDNVLHV